MRTTSSSLLRATGAVLTSLLVTAATAQVGEQLFKWTPSPVVDDAGFGTAVAADDSTVVIGSPDDTGVTPGSGVVSVRDAVSGVEIMILQDADGALGDEFGASVAIGGGLVVIGAPGDGDRGAGSGSVHVFDIATGAAVRKIVASNGSAGDGFGAAVAIDDGVIAIGAPHHDGAGPNAGVVYLFDAVTGEELGIVDAADAAANDSFGAALAMDAGMLVVGAHAKWNGPVFLSGAAYVFDTATGDERFKLLPGDPATSDFFGSAVAIAGGRIAVGAWSKSIVGDHSGAVYLFDAADGDPQGGRISPDDAEDRGHFGRSLAMTGSLLAIGAPGDSDLAFESGSVYLYDVATQVLQVELHATDGAGVDRLGSAVAVTPNRLIAGAPGAGDGGAAYVFALDAVEPCPGDLDRDGRVDGSDLAAILGAWGRAGKRTSSMDINGDGLIDAADLAFVLAGWGDCG